jgi:peptidoglycan/xylan/chitin deacetylase (PgdA/CDA1 family)
VTSSIPELHLFIIWSRAREKEEEIVADLRREFQILDVMEISWSSKEFGRNLTRFYGEALPPGSDKEEHCGNGPFLVVVVRDLEPRYELRHLSPGRAQVVDLHTLEAKERYRQWTGGGHRVHATLEPREFTHDLFLLSARHPSHYEGAESWSDRVELVQADLVGADGWRSLDELLTALRATLGRLAVVELPTAEKQALTVSVDDVWWAAVVANGRPGIEDPWAAEHDIDVAGRRVRLRIVPTEVDDSPPKRAGLRERTELWRARAIDLATRLTSRRAGLALVYHRIGEPPGDRRYEIVPALGLGAFEKQLRALKGRYRVVPASELPRAVQKRRRGGRFPVALTFDDDLTSHARIAAPVLKELSLPATFFLNGGAFGSNAGSAFWWDDLQRAVDQQALSPAALPGIDPTEVTAALERRIGAIRRLAAAIEQAEPAQRTAIAKGLRANGRPGLERPFGCADVRSLAADGFEIGFHTVEHALLPALDDEEVRRALTEGRDELASQTEHPVTLLAYPHGKTDQRVAAAARAAGYTLAYGGSGRALRSDDDEMSLPRWEPPFTGGAAFQLAVARTIRG